MAKRWKYVRTMLANVGYTTIESAEDITIESIDENGYIHYTDENGNEVKATYNSTTPIVVDSDTQTITFVGDLSMVSGTTQTISFDNEDDLDVTSEMVSIVSDDDAVISTGGTYGEDLTAGITGTTTITYEHNDGVTGETSITVTE